jgi:hypothetical protein
MAFEIDLKPVALIDADEAAAWYEKELNGLGKRFLLRLSETLDKLKANPYSHLIVYDPKFVCILKSLSSTKKPPRDFSRGGAIFN